jgi:hypothetical protein
VTYEQGQKGTKMITNVDFVTFNDTVLREVDDALRHTDGVCFEDVIIHDGGNVNVIIFQFNNGRWSANICGNKDDVIRALYAALNK